MNIQHSYRASRPGFTLIEVATSLSIMTVLLLGLSGAVMISSHAIPSTADTGIVDQVAIDAINQLRSDLRETTTIRYRTSSGNAEIQLAIKDAGAAGTPSQVIYTYSADDDTLSRKVDALSAEIVITGVTTFAVDVRQVDGDANVMYFLMYIDGTIQRFFEVHAVLPDKPEVL